MVRNKKLFFIGIIVIGVLVIVGYISAYALWLDEPVLLQHNVEMEMTLREDQQTIERDFELYYITNINDNREVRYVTLPEYPDIYLQSHPNYFTDPKQDAGRYSLRSIRLVLTIDRPENFRQDGMKITKIVMHFSDGSQLEREIGEVMIMFGEEKESITSMGSSSSSLQVRTHEAYLTKNIELVRIDLDQFDHPEEFFDVELNGRKYDKIEGEKIDAGKRIRMRTVTEQPEKITDRLSHYSVEPKIHFLNDDGEEDFIKLYPLVYRPNEIGFLEILEYLRERGSSNE